MIYMNEYDIAMAKQRHAHQYWTQKAIKVLEHLVAETNRCSDGWAHWPLPRRAAAQLQSLIQRGGVSEQEFKLALRPIKAFYTRAGDRARMQRPEALS